MADTEVDVGGCHNMAGIVAGAALGTLAVCTIITGVIVYIICKKRTGRDLKYITQRRDGLDRHQPSSIADSLETGLSNSAYTADSSDSNDVIMMMNSRQDSEEKKNSAKRKQLPASSKNLDCVEVSLIGKEVSGLGFDVKGNPRDGISISSIHERGAARENSNIKVGDKVISLTICFDNMVYEDALTLLSYASPYPITMMLGKKRKDNKHKDNRNSKTVDIAQHYSSDSSTVSDSAQSHDLSDSLSDSSNNSRLRDDVTSPKKGGGDDIDERGSADDEDTDDDTQKRAPTHLPKSIKSLVESKKSGKQAVEVIEDHSKSQYLSAESLESDHGLQLSYGAQNALELILNNHTSDITIHS